MLPFLLVYWRFLRAIGRSLKDPEFQAVGGILLAQLTLGTFFYHRVEGWSYLNSLYFCVITLATVGYGDLSPQTDLGKVFTMVYVLSGIGTLLATVNVVTSSAFLPRLRRRQERAAKARPDEDVSID